MARSVYVPSSSVTVVFAHLNDEVMYNEYEWGDAVSSVMDTLTNKYTSLSLATRWHGREGRVVLANDFVEVGYSGYGSIVAWWVIPKSQSGNVSKRVATLAKNMSKVLDKAVGNYMGDVVEFVGAFSNGEAVFRRKGA